MKTPQEHLRVIPGNQGEPSRAAFSLIELVGILLILGSIMTLVGKILHCCGSIQRLAIQTIRMEKQIDDLRNIFVRDVERALKCSAEPDLLELQTPDQRIQYLKDEDKLLRQCLDGSGKLVERQSWQIEVINFQSKVDVMNHWPLVQLQLQVGLLPQQDATAKQNSDSLVTDQISSRMIRWSVRLGDSAGGNSDAP